MPRVTFVNEQITVVADDGARLLDVAEQAGINLLRGLFQGVRCRRRAAGYRGWCARCKVWAQPASSLSPRTRAERRLPEGTLRLACQVGVHGDVEVRTRAGWVPRAEETT